MVARMIKEIPNLMVPHTRVPFRPSIFDQLWRPPRVPFLDFLTNPLS
jgi:hypothetical protein